MKRFLFITHMTPREKRSPLRQRMIEQYMRALENQSYPHWKAVILGEDDKQEGRFEYLHLPRTDRAEQLENIRKLLAGERFQSIAADTDYIIKVDDDDLVSSGLLERASKLDFDLYYDTYHTFYDISSGIITQQKRDWVASTCIHRREHILAPWSGAGATAVGNLLYTEHSLAWRAYYEHKNKLSAPRELPVYLRVLSPTSISSGALSAGGVKSFSDVSMPKYMEYLRSFGDWKAAPVSGFEAALPELAAAWEAFSGKKQQPLPPMAPSGWKKLFKKRNWK